MIAPIALTAGDPAGIGPELLVRLLLELRHESDIPIAVISSRDELRMGLAQSGVDADIDELLLTDHFSLVEVEMDRPDASGAVSSEAGRWALACLERALELHSVGQVSGLVFGPLNKTSLHLAGMTEPDEMRWFETRVGGHSVVSEVNVTTTFWTARVTSHVALRDVAALITPASVMDATRLLHDLLVRAGNDAPRIAVCALNPHAGENGLFGNEEIDAIAPAVALAQQSGIDASGPFPCDTIFRKGFDGTYDGIVTMYHDQGQIALKTHSFDGGVTLEAGLGLPICTPAHGTAFDIVATGQASLTSMWNAFQLTKRLVSAGV